VGRNLEAELSKPAETGLAVKDSVRLANLNKMLLQDASILASTYETDETEFHNSCVDDHVDTVANDEQCFPDIEVVASAVLQTNGEFMCGSCGVMMKSARAIKRHLSTHVSLHSFQLPTTLSCETAFSSDNVSKDDVVQKQPKEQPNACKRLPTPDVSAESSKRLWKPESNKDTDKKWRSYPCTDCDNIFTARELLQRHRIQMHKPNQCQKCGMVLAGRKNFSQHVRDEHPGLPICKVPVFHCYLFVTDIALCS